MDKLEKLTISRVGVPKKIEGISKRTNKPYSFQKVGFQSVENPGQWYDISFDGNLTLETGKTYEFLIKSREYNGKTYYDASFPTEKTEATRALLRHEKEIQNLWAAVREIQNSQPTKSYSYQDIPIVQEPVIEFDESGAPIRTEPDYNSIRPEDVPF